MEVDTFAKRVSTHEKRWPKPLGFKYGQDEGSLNLFIGFLKVNIDEQGIQGRILGPFHSFPNCNDIVENV